MSTLPFLLSVADELDNLNSQSYLDDFGLGFHPHRQYYRSPTIQLSLPASTEWMEQEQSRHHSRYRSTFRYYGEPQNNLQSPAEGDEEDNDAQESSAHDKDSAISAAASSSAAQKYVSALNSNTDKDDILDNSLQLYNISKKCSKDYYRHSEPCTSSASTLSTAISASTSKPPPLPPRMSTAAAAAAAATAAKNKDNKPNMSYRLHSKCLEGTNSSSEESLQKVTSSIEFLTCFLLKKTRISKNDSGAEGKKS